MAQKTKFNMLVTKWIVADTLPFSIVSSQSFATMFRYLNSSIELPSCDVIKSIIQKAFAIMQKDIQFLFEQISSKISIILDIWTSYANVLFICIMAHWIDSDWNLKKILLDICMLLHPHTNDEIDTKLHSVFVAFNITNKILCATTNRSSNMISAMRLLKDNLVLQNYNFYFQSRCCLAHVLNLVVTNGLLSIKSSIEKVRNFVNVVSSSLSLTQNFKELGQSVGEATIRCNKKLEKFKLTPQEEANLQAAAQFLKLFYETTNVLSGSTYMILGISILLIDDIVENISSCIQNLESPEFLKTATTQMFEKIQKYANEIYDKMAFIAAILDPRIKLELIPVDINTEANHTIFNNIFRTEYADLVLNNSSTFLTSSPTHTSSPSSISVTSSTSSISSISSISPTNLVWKLNCTRFPYLSQMAKNYLAIQSTSVPSEQVFSKAGDTV
ncbi:18507_t:CDS:2 [Gigaspora margarita]|uniref:18507_t:CDS:1 n=1 Tax=Gigaspora margarita TaxID=4874 RepID=A0ABN7UWJ3_GIGMA|nr:18507_t:CDS:2 [Gigaspora margarita]